MAAIRVGQGLLVGLLRCGTVVASSMFDTGELAARMRAISARANSRWWTVLHRLRWCIRGRRLSKEVLQVISRWESMPVCARSRS